MKKLPVRAPGFVTALPLRTSPAMAAQYQAFAQMWQQQGGDLCNFSTNIAGWGGPNYWGMFTELSYIDDLSNPACTKYKATAALNNTAILSDAQTLKHSINLQSPN